MTARSFFSMTEPDVSGADPTSLQTTAVLEGDEWVIDGRKWFSSGAEGALFGIVMAVTEPDAEPRTEDEPDHRPGRRAGCRRSSRCRTLGHRGPRLDDALRGDLQRRARAGGEPPRRAGRRLPHRTEAARAGPHPSRHAVARADAARVRPDVRAGARAGGVRRAARGEADGAELDRGLGGRDPGVPPADARRRAQDRPATRMQGSRSRCSSSTRRTCSRA